MTKLKEFGREHRAVSLLLPLVFVLAAAGVWFAANQAKVEQANINFAVPNAPTLTPGGSGQTVYRIDAGRSTVRYEVEEQLAGVSNTAVGTTRGIAGDILVDEANPANSKVGDIVINVEQLTSDQALRDQRIRHDHLESSRYPLVTYKTNRIDGMPGSISDGTDYKVTLQGDLTVKTTTAPVAVEATVRREGGALRINGTANVKLSTFGVGPISMIGFVSTGDDAKLVFDLAAKNAVGFSHSALAETASDQVVKTGSGPSFAATVKPVLEQRCASCHNSGTAGASIWTLDTAGDASKVANGLGLVVKSDYMPPWLASDKGVPLEHSLKLSPEEKQALMAWAEAGGALDVDPATPVKAAPESIREPQRDATLAMAESYQGSPDKPNDYRCFALDPKLAAPTPVVGYQFLPDKKEVVHHALVFRMKASTRERTDQADADGQGPGWECFGGVGGRGSSDGLTPSGEGRGSELVMGWAPGQLPSIYPDGAALIMEPGDYFVVQMHYHYAHGGPADQSSIALDYGDKPVESYDQVRVRTYLAPAEIPCDASKGETGPLCNRDAAIAELTKQYGPAASFIANGLHLLCGTKVEQLAKLEGGIASASCDHRVRSEGEIIAVLGHEHEIGRTYRMTLNPGTPEEKILLDIPRWDFNWQLNYQPKDKIQLKRGDVIRVECTWDRALIKPGGEPRWITWSEGTEDEMCFSTIATREKPDAAGSSAGSPVGPPVTSGR